MRIAHAELPDDVLPHLMRRRRGEREHRRAAEPRHHGTQREIVRAEVVSPLTDAMRFVHDKETHVAREQPIEELAVLEAFGCEIENLAFTVLYLSRGLARLGRVEM